MSILDTAKALVNGDRQKAYGHPLDDYETTAAIWTQILKNELKEGVSISAEKAILCMIGVKISRESRLHQQDNLIDIAGYDECLDLVITERAKRDRTIQPQFIDLKSRSTGMSTLKEETNELSDNNNSN